MADINRLFLNNYENEIIKRTGTRVSKEFINREVRAVIRRIEEESKSKGGFINDLLEDTLYSLNIQYITNNIYLKLKRGRSTC